MSALAEQVLLGHLTDSVSLAVMAAEGLTPEALPTPVFRPIYIFALEYYHDCGRTKAPSPQVLDAQFHSTVVEHELSFVDPSDSIEWAIATLRGSHAHKAGQDFTYAMARSMAEAAESGEGIAAVTEVIHAQATALIGLSMDLERADQKVSLSGAGDDVLSRFEERAKEQTAFGLGLGLPQVDTHTYRLHPGELGIVAAPPKTGKSYFAAKVVLEEWIGGRSPVLFTLENSVDMTLDRMACLATGVSGRAFERGLSSDEEIERVRTWVGWAKEADVEAWVLQPQAGQRSPEHLIRKAVALGAESVVVDQLSHVEAPDPRKPKNERFAEIMVGLRQMITPVRTRLPCLCIHQISRAGVEAADKIGHLDMRHLAESAEIERTADIAYGMYQSPDNRRAKMMLLQILAARRCDIMNWILHWDINVGHIQVRRQFRTFDE